MSIWVEFFQSSRTMTSFNLHYTKDIFGAMPIESKLSCSRNSLL